ncbi:hypothetical protein Pla111_30550 [Botrimarina hoheduenensis]|uniref:Uncharacterized protein n=1 Tax=Botrimarina hoheduenensis TaxID=2528000 RepID=A0A5C5VUR3_9BACT|nr:hypothetical protein Pla111_30550 [Botrimarina hoheduenensis]
MQQSITSLHLLSTKIAQSNRQALTCEFPFSSDCTFRFPPIYCLLQVFQESLQRTLNTRPKRAFCDPTVACNGPYRCWLYAFGNLVSPFHHEPKASFNFRIASWDGTLKYSFREVPLF